MKQLYEPQMAVKLKNNLEAKTARPFRSGGLAGYAIISSSTDEVH